MAGSIGIKQANGEFYSILDENSAANKRLVLTTVHDNQKSVQIDLFKSTTKNMADAVYIGSLVVENIGQKLKGEPSIEMTLSSTQDGSISASAVDLANPDNEHHLSISLKSLEEDKNEYPDFDIETSQTAKKSKPEPMAPPPRKFPLIEIIIIGVVLALACLGLWFFLFHNKKDGKVQSIRQSTRTVAAQPRPDPHITEKPPAAAPQPERIAPQPERAAPAPQIEQEPAIAAPVTTPAAAPVAAPAAKPAAAPVTAPVIVEKPPEPRQQPPPRTRTRAPVYSFNVPETIPPEGIVYTIRYGDTLWDISEAFYRNPRLYPFIVRSNGIRNPNLIVSGMELTILPRV